MLIRIARTVRLTLLDSDVQTLRPGEMYDVAPAVGGVLVADGWAAEVAADRRDPPDPIATAADDPCDEISGL